MKIGRIIEEYFWVILVAGILIGLWNPVNIPPGKYLPKILLGLMLFFVFLKIDVIKVLENIRNYRLMIYIVLCYLIIIPLIFFIPLQFIDKDIATGILLLTAMPAGLSSPALTEIAKGNVPLSMSLAIISQVAAPFSVPLLFWITDIQGLEINELLIFKDISLLIFIPVLLSQLMKRFLPGIIRRTQPYYTSANIIVLFLFVYITIASQRRVILENPASLVWQIILLYSVFILLHIIGYFIWIRGDRSSRIAVSIGAAYMNNGMAIVLAAAYFKPEILVLMVLSELPWNTLLEPFRRFLRVIG